MPAEVTATSIQKAVIATLQDALIGLSENLKEDWEDYAEDIARDVAVNTKKAMLRGNKVTVRNVKHLEAQAKLLASMIAIREQDRIAKIITDVLTIALQVLGRAVFGALAV